MTPPVSLPGKMLSERTQKLVRKLKHEGGVVGSVIGGGGLGGIVGGVIGGSDQGVVSRGTPRISGDGLTMSDEVKLVFDKYTKLPTATAAVTAEKTD